MQIITLELPAEQVPIVGGDDFDRAALLGHALVDTIGEQVGRVRSGDGDPEFMNIAREFSKGIAVVYITMHVEPALVKRGRRG